ncbi:MAG: hypothetical protein F6K30_05540 [Cyanothece sp. SIO2G6]|nr:hypothetical protein [Cyanothece sp. SIO2G6]
MATDTLPDVVRLEVIRDTTDVIDSYFDLTIYDTVLEGNDFNAWCVDKYTFITVGEDYSATVYSSYETIPANLISRRENLDLVNWIINQDYISRGFSAAAIQDAIWELVETDYIQEEPNSSIIVQEAIDNGEGFVPDYGEKVAVVYAPISEEGEEQQTLIDERIVLTPGIDVEKYVSVDDGATWFDADTPTGPFTLGEEDPLFKFVVTNTGEVDLNDITLSDSDFDLNGTAPGTDITIDFLAPQETYEYTFTEAQWQPGQHANTATVTTEYRSDLTQQTDILTDSDDAHYYGATPAIDIEKFTNGKDADTIDDALGLAPGEALTWTYEVTNTGNVAFTADQITVLDDLEGTPTLVASSDVGGDGILSPNEQWHYEITAPGGAENLMYSLDFETRPDGTPLAAGDDLTTAYADWGVTISTNVTPDQLANGMAETPLPMVFDTSNPTGNDPDLGSPNKDFGGPGKGIGGSEGSLYQNNRALDNVAIISQDNDSTDPNDNGKGGTLRFDFDAPVFLEYAEILDASKPATIATFDEAGNVIEEYAISTPDPTLTDWENKQLFGRNNFQTLSLTDDFATAVEFRFEDSAGVANLVFTEYYQNTATVTVEPSIPDVGELGPITDTDTSTYITENPSFTLEKSTNGKDADVLEDAAVVAAGETVIWQYRLYNDGNIDLNSDDINVVDDQGVVLTLNATTDVGGDGVLSPGEQWSYFGEEIAADLSFVVDFETDADGNELESGDTIDTEYQGVGMTISTPGHEFGAMIFDTANVTGQDGDLRDPNLKSGKNLLGNVLILSEDGDASDADDNAKGGIFRFDFDDLIGISGVNMLDIDKGEMVTVRSFDEAGALLDTQVFDGAGNNKQQTLDINSGLIASLEVELTGSGAIAGLEGDRFYSNIATAALNWIPTLIWPIG